jgi:endonuclease YncB( thermonuclease family)
VNECDQKQYSGIIKISGKILFSQFFGEKTEIDGRSVWGGSDADTCKLTLNSNPIKFQSSPDSSWQDNIRLFDKAFSYEEETGKRINIIGTDLDNSKIIKIRLQGLDAPELHYRAIKGDTFLYDDKLSVFNTIKEAFDLRQAFGAKAANKLVEFLKEYSTNEKFVNAYALSSIDKPSQLIDKFGRAICDIYVYNDDENNGINVNQWLVKEGWAFPDFYDSMSNEEITTLRKLGNDAGNQKAGMRNFLSNSLLDLDYNLLLDKENAKQIIDNENGKLNLPKFFRKQVDWKILGNSGSKVKNLKKFISNRKTICYKVDEFLEKRNNAEIYQLSDFISEDGIISVGPGDLVNIESESVLEAPNIITNWN